jgi:hypothetical protein
MAAAHAISHNTTAAVNLAGVQRYIAIGRIVRVGAVLRQAEKYFEKRR